MQRFPQADSTPWVWPAVAGWICCARAARLVLVLITCAIHVLTTATVAFSSTDDALHAELRELDRMRRGRQTPFAEAEKRAADLLKKHTAPADQGQIYFALVQVYGQSAGPPERIIHYAKKALELPVRPEQRSRLHTYWGDALFVLDPSKPLPERRREATRAFLAGLAKLSELNLPDNPPEIPAFELRETDENPQAEEQRNKVEIALAEQARFLRTMIRQRDVLIGQIASLYARKPMATDELRDLTMKTTNDTKLADRLMKAVDAKIKTTKMKYGPNPGPAKQGADYPSSRQGTSVWRWWIVGANVIIAGVLACISYRRRRRRSTVAP